MLDVKSKSAGCKDRLISEIAIGIRHENERFPSERELSERHQVSRSTVRLAIEDLINEGLLVRRGKVGAFVAEGALHRAAELAYGTAGTMSAAWLMTPGETNNPLMQTVFNTCSEYLNPNIRFNIRFGFAGAMSHPAPEQNSAVVCCRFTPDQLGQLQQLVKNVIVLNVRNPNGNYLTPDNFAGGRMMAECALRHGHRKVCCLANLTGGEASDFGQRYLGIKAVFDEHGLELETAFMEQFYYMDLEASTHYALETVLTRRPDISMILCSCDLVAFGAMASLQLRNRRIPDDISIIGFDDQCYSRSLGSGLTTVKYPAEAIGIKLAEYINAVAGGETPILQETVRPLLLERGSVRNI